MGKSAALWFGIGCFVIIVASFSQLEFRPLIIMLAVGVCIWQWRRHTRELKNEIVQEQSMRLFG